MDFHQDMNKQLNDIKSELTKVFQKVEEVENRVGEVEDCTQNMGATSSNETDKRNYPAQ